MDVTMAHPDPPGRRQRPDPGAQGQVFYNSEYGELAGRPEESDGIPSAQVPFFTDSSY